MIKIGIVGMPNAGKSTLFNALSESEAVVAPYAFSTVEPNKAVINARDPDFELLGKTLDAPDLKYNLMQLWDIAGLIKGASHGEGLGNEFLGQMKDCDVLLHVVRVEESTSAEEINHRLATVNNEIALFDHKLLLKPFEKARRLKRLFQKDIRYQLESELFTKAYYGTRDGTPIKDVIDKDNHEVFLDIGLISLKSQIVIANIDETPNSRKVAEEIGADLILNAEEILQLESLTFDERKELGFGGNEIDMLAYALVKSILSKTEKKQVYTVGHLGIGQWIVDEEANSQVCATMLHGEMESDVKNVKVAELKDFMVHKTWQTLSKVGKVKIFNASKHIPHDKQVLLFD